MFQLPYYYWYEMTHAAIAPRRAMADAARLYFRHPLNPLSNTPLGKHIGTSCELFERATRRYEKPEFNIKSVQIEGEEFPVEEKIAWQRPFCNLLSFKRLHAGQEQASSTPRILIVAPMSGNYAALLRNTVEGLLPYYDVYITDWANVRDVPIAEGEFDLDDYIDYVLEILRVLGPNVHTIGISQSSVPLLAAAALMEEAGETARPASLILMCSPIDTRISPTFVGDLAHGKDKEWFRRYVITMVPKPYPGQGRPVYPGFLHVSGLLAMPLSGRMGARFDEYIAQYTSELRKFYQELHKGEGDSVDDASSIFAAMDLTAEFFIQTMETVFSHHALPKGEMRHRERTIDLSAIHRAGLMTVEAGDDVICGQGQTEAAQTLCVNIPAHLRQHHREPGVGHYGVCITSRFQAEIVPRIRDFTALCGKSDG